MQAHLKRFPFRFENFSEAYSSRSTGEEKFLNLKGKIPNGVHSLSKTRVDNLNERAPMSLKNEPLNCKRILLKLSGEMLMEGQPFGVNPLACQNLAKNIKDLHDTDLEIGIVIGGGNIFRGTHLEAIGIERSPADTMGMLATLINGTVLQETLRAAGCPAILLSALEAPKVAENYSWRAAMDALDSKKVAIFVGGTGNPYFTTDTAAALRASEIKANILLKATKVDGVYSKDPVKYKDAKKYHELSYSEVLAEKLGIMDATAIALCRSNKIPILVFNMNILKTNATDILSNHNGTLIRGE